MVSAFYPGSFDPVTFGHLDIIKRANKLFSPLYIGVGVNLDKQAFLSVEQRLELLQKVIPEEIDNSDNIILRHFDSLLVDAMHQCNSEVLIRGLRDTTDYNYEMQLAAMNEQLASNVQTVFLSASANYRHISASLVRQIIRFGGDVSAFMPSSAIAKVIEQSA